MLNARPLRRVHSGADDVCPAGGTNYKTINTEAFFFFIPSATKRKILLRFRRITVLLKPGPQRPVHGIEFKNNNNEKNKNVVLRVTRPTIIEPTVQRPFFYVLFCFRPYQKIPKTPCRSPATGFHHSRI